MKKITLMLVSLWLMTAFVIAQIPQAFKYQAVARTITGNLIQNQFTAARNWPWQKSSSSPRCISTRPMDRYGWPLWSP